MPPTLPRALGLGLRAVLREPWLIPVGAVVAGARRVALWPAWLVLAAIAFRGAVAGVAERPLDPGAPLDGALAALLAPRAGALVAGLLLGGVCVSAALRVAWLAGALPTLGRAMAGAPPEPVFARGIAYALPRVLAAAALAAVAELAGALFGITLAGAALRVLAHAGGTGSSPALAAASALALTLAVAVPLALGAFADAAVARAAIRGEGPAEALAAGAARLLARPGSFLLGAIAFGLAGLVGPASAEAAGGVAVGFAPGVAPVVLLGPRLLAAAAALGLVAALDLWWLGTVSALACAGDPPGPTA